MTTMTIKKASWMLGSVKDVDGVKLNRVDPLTFRKQVIYEGTHVKGKSDEFTIDEDMLDHWVDTGNQMLANDIEIPMPTKHNEDNPELNRGFVNRFVKGLDSKGRQALFVWGRFTDAAAAKLAKRSNVSLFCPPEKSIGGTTYHRPITHVCFTNYPVIRGLDGFASLSLSRSHAFAHVPDHLEGDDTPAAEGVAAIIEQVVAAVVVENVMPVVDVIVEEVESENGDGPGTVAVAEVEAVIAPVVETVVETMVAQIVEEVVAAVADGPADDDDDDDDDDPVDDPVRPVVEFSQSCPSCKQRRRKGKRGTMSFGANQSDKIDAAGRKMARKHGQAWAVKKGNRVLILSELQSNSRPFFTFTK